MPCIPIQGGVICTPRGVVYRMYLKCPTCDRKRLMAARDEMWYGTHVTCTGCGDSWQDGIPMPRPFKPRWREAAIADAKKQLQHAVTQAEAREWIRAELEEMFSEREDV